MQESNNEDYQLFHDHLSTVCIKEVTNDIMKVNSFYRDCKEFLKVTDPTTIYKEEVKVTLHQIEQQSQGI